MKSSFHANKNKQIMHIYILHVLSKYIYTGRNSNKNIMIFWLNIFKFHKIILKITNYDKSKKIFKLEMHMSLSLQSYYLSLGFDFKSTRPKINSRLHLMHTNHLVINHETYSIPKMVHKKTGRNKMRLCEEKTLYQEDITKESWEITSQLHFEQIRKFIFIFCLYH